MGKLKKFITKKTPDVSKPEAHFKKWKKVESYEKLKKYPFISQLSGVKGFFRKGESYESTSCGNYKKINIVRVSCNKETEITIKFNFDTPSETIVFAEIAARISHTLGNLYASYSKKKKSKN